MSQTETHLRKIIEIYQRIYNRYTQINQDYKKKNPNSQDCPVGPGELDAYELDITKAKLELARHQEQPRKTAPTPKLIHCKPNNPYTRANNHYIINRTQFTPTK